MAVVLASAPGRSLQHRTGAVTRRDSSRCPEPARAKGPDNADAYSYLGYCERMLGDREQALAQFDLPKAKEQLGALARLCGGTCGEYRGLQEEVQKFKTNERRG